MTTEWLSVFADEQLDLIARLCKSKYGGLMNADKRKSKSLAC